MAMSRSFGSTSFTTLPSIRIVPEVIASSPAVILSTVDLPQPEGPTNATNWPRSTPRLKSLTAFTVPNDLWMASNSTKGGMSAPGKDGLRHFTAPSVSPRTRCRCISSTKIRIGRLMPIAPAADRDQ